jgi:hypothetical protein
MERTRSAVPKQSIAVVCPVNRFRSPGQLRAARERAARLPVVRLIFDSCEGRVGRKLL